MLSENTQETNGTVVDWIWPQRTKERCAMTKMTRTLTALAAAATLGLAAVTAPQPAEAHWRGGGGAVAAGIIGGLAAGAIIGSAAAHGPYYGSGYYYGAGSAYYDGCYWTRQRVWDGWGWRLRPVRVCG
jgi:hypothetical protein